MLDDDSHLAPSKLCFTRGHGFGFRLSCRCSVTPSGCCHRTGVNPAATSPFWGLTVTSSHNKFSTATGKHLTMHFLGKLLTHFLPFREAYFGKRPECVPLGINITRNAFFTPLLTRVILFLSQKIIHHSEGQKYGKYLFPH